MLLCERENGQALWARPLAGGEWRLCPLRLDFQVARTEAFEVCGGDRYVLLFRGRGAGGGGCLNSIVMFDLVRNEWLPLLGPTRSRPGGNVGEPPVRWRPVEIDPGVRCASHAPLLAWLLESTPDYLMLLAPVSRDGVQRGTSDRHSAVHFIGHCGEVVSHHLPCSASRLTMHRYDGFFLFVKDFDEHPEGNANACMDDDWQPSYQGVAGWLLAAEDTAVPPMQISLPQARDGWGGGSSPWSLVISRGNLQEQALSHHMRQDTAPRLYLLEAGPVWRLWASRRIDDSFDTLYQRHTLDRPQLIRHSLTFSPLQQSELEVGGDSAASSWLLWSPDLRHLARLLPTAAAGGAGKLAFWRCAVQFSGEGADTRALNPRAYAAAVDFAPHVSPVELLSLGKRGWDEPKLPMEDAGGAVYTGLPCFPALRRGEGNFQRTQDWWIHPMGRDPASHVPLAILR
mmetsp:Transcript_62353/g.175834  ORF Transcript_62353/g.175834 Transcript_62353/m.175834 type:complete len:456 (-) Transcript_62353:107-1474(-)